MPRGRHLPLILDVSAAEQHKIRQVVCPNATLPHLESMSPLGYVIRIRCGARFDRQNGRRPRQLCSRAQNHHNKAQNVEIPGQLRNVQLLSLKQVDSFSSALACARTRKEGSMCCPALSRHVFPCGSIAGLPATHIACTALEQ